MMFFIHSQVYSRVYSKHFRPLSSIKSIFLCLSIFRITLISFFQFFLKRLRWKIDRECFKLFKKKFQKRSVCTENGLYLTLRGKIFTQIINCTRTVLDFEELVTFQGEVLEQHSKNKNVPFFVS